MIPGNKALHTSSFYPPWMSSPMCWAPLPPKKLRGAAHAPSGVANAQKTDEREQADQTLLCENVSLVCENVSLIFNFCRSLYILNISAHSKTQRPGVVKGEFLRVMTLSSSQKAFDEARGRHHKAFQRRGLIMFKCVSLFPRT